MKLGGISIAKVEIPLKSRDELPPILMALKHLYVTSGLKAEAFRILEEKILRGKKKMGRNGMELWHILVLSEVRMGLDADYDRLEDFANHHSLIRKIMGVETGFGEGVIKSISFDKGFYKKENKELLCLYIPAVIMPKSEIQNPKSKIRNRKRNRVRRLRS